MMARLVPDLGNELMRTLLEIEEVLLTLAAYEERPDSTGYVLDLPVPVAQRHALQALRRIEDSLWPTQSHTFPRRVRADQPTFGRPAFGRQLGPDGLDEHQPLRLVEIDQADLDVLGQTTQVLGQELATRPHSELSVAIADGAHTAIGTGVWREADDTSQMLVAMARVRGLLDLVETADTRLLAARLRSAPAGHDIVFTAEQQEAHRRFINRSKAVWALSEPFSR